MKAEAEEVLIIFERINWRTTKKAMQLILMTAFLQ